MFAALIDTKSIGVAVDALAAEYGQPRERIAADVQRFLDDLLERGLIEVLDGDGG
jgi:hypothetical protein